jgi:hypothetical protein
LTSQLARGEQLELRISLLFAALFAPSSALACLEQMLNGAVSGFHAVDARKPEDEAIDLTSCMIGGPSSAVATHEQEREGYPIESVGVGSEIQAENFGKERLGCNSKYRELAT